MSAKKAVALTLLVGSVAVMVVIGGRRGGDAPPDQTPPAAVVAPPVVAPPVAATVRAVVDLEPLGDSRAHGRLYFRDGSDDGLHIRARLMGVEPGAHSLHVYPASDCGALVASGAASLTGAGQSGEAGLALGEVLVPAHGHCDAKLVRDHVSLAGPPAGIAMQSVIVRADHGRADSAAGRAIACGIVRLR